MSLGKQSKTLNENQIKYMTDYLSKTTYSERNLTVFFLSIKGGLRSKEIANLKWNMVLDSNGEIGDTINLTNNSSKGKSGGRVIPLNKQLKEQLKTWYFLRKSNKWLNDLNDSYVINSQRSNKVKSQTIINTFSKWYKNCGFVGCSSHSGRRTFITNLSKKISLVGGSLKDVMELAGHKHLQTTQLYIQGDEDSKKKVVNLI